MRWLLLTLFVELMLFAEMRGSLFTRLSRRWEQHEISKIKKAQEIPMIKEAENVRRTSSSKPFLPFSDLGAPAGPLKINSTIDLQSTTNFHNSIENGIYTTLDKLQKSHTFKKKPNYKKLGEDLGGLNPEEIFYIDKDILIIKGGDFRDSAYEKARLISKKKIDEQSINAFKKFSFNKENDLDDKSSVLHPSSSSSQLPTSQLSLFLPSLQIPEQSQKYYQYTYHPSSIRGIYNHSYFPFRNSYYTALFSDPFPRKFKYTSSINNLKNEPIPYLFPKQPKKFASFSLSPSLLRDIDVNYSYPSPSEHPDAEWFVNNLRIKRE